MTISATALTIFIAWTLFLLVVGEVIRSWMVLTGRVRSNQFSPDNANLSPFMQRLARAHANCIEGFPIFGGLLLLAISSGRHELTDTLAPWLVAARILQSTIHVLSTTVTAVNLRFSFFAVQVFIALAWTVSFLATLRGV